MDILRWVWEGLQKLRNIAFTLYHKLCNYKFNVDKIVLVGGIVLFVGLCALIFVADWDDIDLRDGTSHGPVFCVGADRNVEVTIRDVDDFKKFNSSFSKPGLDFSQKIFHKFNSKKITIQDCYITFWPGSESESPKFSWLKNTEIKIWENR